MVRAGSSTTTCYSPLRMPIVLKGWDCPTCRAFNGEELAELRECRCCGTLRPVTREIEEYLLQRNLYADVARYCADSNVTLAEAFGKSRSRHIAHVRHGLMAHFRALGWSYRVISELFDCHHSSVVAAVQNMTKSKSRS